MKHHATFQLIGVFVWHSGLDLLLLPPSRVAANGEVPFGAKPVMTDATDGARSVHAANMDGDGDMDTLSVSRYDDKTTWYENPGGQFALARIDTAHRKTTPWPCYLHIRGQERDEFDQWMENITRPTPTPGVRS